MDVIGIRVNAVDIKVDPSVFAMSRDGRAGFVIDSGYEFTSLSNVAFDVLKNTLYEILGTPITYAGFEICYQFGTVWRSKPKPVIGIMFRGWLFELDERNVWGKMDNKNMRLECLLVHRSPGIKLSVLGAAQLFNVNVGHDLNNNLLYLQPMKCPTSVDP
ncbi:aspartic proteinase nepenthesin-2-like [Silene latifolia]|uniref:aspartic proteinase nepenthesin-2-like n=1 Tax=Silene latifolia TaxID=37657 RepID=UPI003D76BF74